MKNFKDLMASKSVRRSIGIVGALILALLIFHAGVVVGSHRSQFGRYGMDRGFRPPFAPNGFEMPSAFIETNHGAVGTVTVVTLPTITVRTREGVDRDVFISTSTVIRSMDSQTAKILSEGDQVVVLGAPDSEGRINAQIIRVLPSLPPTR